MKEVRQLEEAIAEFYGAKYAIATDCCTHAIELCLRLQDIKNATNSCVYLGGNLYMTFLCK